MPQNRKKAFTTNMNLTIDKNLIQVVPSNILSIEVSLTHFEPHWDQYRHKGRGVNCLKLVSNGSITISSSRSSNNSSNKG